MSCEGNNSSNAGDGSASAASVIVGGHEPLVRLTTYIDGILESKIVTLTDAKALPETLFDIDIDLVAMTFVVRKADGSIVQHSGRIKGLGKVLLDLMVKFFHGGGSYLSPYDVSQMEPDHDSHGPCLETYVCRLRRLIFDETASTQHCLLSTRPLAYAVNPELNFRLIERLESLDY